MKQIITLLRIKITVRKTLFSELRSRVIVEDNRKWAMCRDWAEKVQDRIVGLCTHLENHFYSVAFPAIIPASSSGSCTLTSTISMPLVVLYFILHYVTVSTALVVFAFLSFYSPHNIVLKTALILRKRKWETMYLINMWTW